MRTACVIVLAASSALAEGADFVLPTMDVLDFGVRCKAGDNTIVSGQDTIDGEVVLSNSFSGYDIQTNRVPAHIGLSFGTHLRVMAPADSGVYIARVTHPPMGPERRTEQTWRSMVGPGEATIAYLLEDDFELLPGHWQFQLLDGETIVFQRSFEMIPAGKRGPVETTCFGAPTS